MFIRIHFKIPEDEYRALEQWAEQETRPVVFQILHVLRQELIRNGFLPQKEAANACKSTAEVTGAEATCGA